MNGCMDKALLMVDKCPECVGQIIEACSKQNTYTALILGGFLVLIAIGLTAFAWKEF